MIRSAACLLGFTVSILIAVPASAGTAIGACFLPCQASASSTGWRPT